MRTFGAALLSTVFGLAWSSSALADAPRASHALPASPHEVPPETSPPEPSVEPHMRNSGEMVVGVMFTLVGAGRPAGGVALLASGSHQGLTEAIGNGAVAMLMFTFLSPCLVAGPIMIGMG